MILIMGMLPIERTAETVRQFPRYLIYTAILLQTIAVLQYQIARLNAHSIRITPDDSSLSHEIDGSSLSHETKNPQYEKSLIADYTMDVYQERLKRLIENKVFQDTELSLEGLAKQIGAPKHHLTQLLNLRMKKTFNQYI